MLKKRQVTRFAFIPPVYYAGREKQFFEQASIAVPTSKHFPTL